MSTKNKANILAISKFYSLPLSISTLLVNRGVENEENIENYFKKEYKLSSPMQFPTMKNALKRINKALISDEKIVIFGDYDVDGMIATSMLFLYLKKIKANVDYYIPDRKVDGYGFNKNTVKKLIEEYNSDLVISVDTGITAKDEIEELKKFNIDVIITDHHEVQLDKIPNAVAVINPKFIKDDKYNLKSLSGGGVAFYLIRAINSSLFSEGKRQKIVDYLVLAMITSISDMMTLKGDNRLIVEHGLQYLFETEILGLNLLLNKIKFYDYPNAIDVGMMLSPILNSAGRIGDPNTIIELMTDDTLVSYSIVEKLIQLNSDRKEMSKKYYSDCIKDVDDKEELIVIDKKDYEIGLIGLIATRICYEKLKPIIVIGSKGDDGLRKVSMRSLCGIELTPLLEILKNDVIGGGHDYAVGFSIEESKVDTVVQKIKEFVKNKKVITNNDPEIELDFSEIDPIFCRLLYAMEPFGKGNPRPLIKIKNIQWFKELKLLKKEHYLLEVSEMLSGISFFVSDDLKLKFEKIKEAKNFSILCETYSLGDKLKILIKDIDIID